MKIIDLLNKIANGEVVPKIILYKGFKYCKNNWNDTYYKFGCSECDTLNIDTYDLNNTVEIIEEPQPKKIEKWQDLAITLMKKQEDIIDDDIKKIKNYIETIMRTQNEIIDCLEEENEQTK